MCQSSWNVGASTSRNPQCLSRPVIGMLYLFTLILRETRLDGLLRFLSYTFTKYNSFSAESISALNTHVWEECFIYNYSALCGIGAFQTIHNLHFPFTGPSALSFLPSFNCVIQFTTWYTKMAHLRFSLYCLSFYYHSKPFSCFNSFPSSSELLLFPSLRNIIFSTANLHTQNTLPLHNITNSKIAYSLIRRP
jgi:hypothetical protein